MRKYIWILSVLILACCKEDEPEECYDPADPECENYDPCYEVVKPDASFLMEDQIRNEDSKVIYIPEDSIFIGTSIRFRSLYENDKYKHTWYVGTEVLSGYKVERLFRDVPRPEHITIHHVLEYPVDSSCFPGDDGRDSISQGFYLIEYFDELEVFGEYKVAEPGSQDTFRFEIKVFSEETEEKALWGESYDVYGINFLNQDDSTHLRRFFPTNTYASFEVINSTGGYIRIDPETGHVEIQYDQLQETYNLEGYKIN